MMKKLDQKGIAHHLLLAVLALLVVGGTAFAGWRVYKNKSTSAKAETPCVKYSVAQGSGNTKCVKALQGLLNVNDMPLFEQQHFSG